MQVPPATQLELTDEIAQARQTKRTNEVQKRPEKAKKSTEVKSFPFFQ